jgi:glycosyltransferase involved in cell wall biosynthesis
VVGDGALLVDPSDPAALAEALAQVLVGGAEVDGLVARGTRRSAEFSWDACARGLAGLYEEARVSRTSGPGRHHGTDHHVPRDAT